MAHTELSAMQLANIALSVAIDMGFNAVQAATQYDIVANKTLVRLDFDDYERMKERPMPRAIPCARSYDAQAKCIREHRIVEPSESILHEAPGDIRTWLAGQLLELDPN